MVDMALLLDWRGHWIGSRILGEVIERASKVGKAVSIHVEQFNPAMKLFLRTGFEKVQDEGFYHLVKLNPQEQASTTTRIWTRVT